MSVSVIDQTTTVGVEIIFHIQEDTNSPYQGRLIYSKAVFDALAPSQISDQQIAQYSAWKAAQVLSPDQLTAREIAGNIDAITAQGSTASISLANSTANQNLAALRAVYQTASQTQAIMIGDFFNTLTNVQLQNIFSITLLQAQALRTNKLAPAATVATAIRTAAGQ